MPAVATGNWGCGVFHGNPQLKVLLQLMAASVAGRSVVYFTFGDAELRDSVSEMYWHLVQQNVDIGKNLHNYFLNFLIFLMTFNIKMLKSSSFMSQVSCFPYSHSIKNQCPGLIGIFIVSCITRAK